MRYKRNTEVLFLEIIAKTKIQAVTSLTEPFRLEMKKTHMLRCAQSPRYNVLAKHASARRFFARLASESFEQPAIRVFQQPARAKPVRNHTVESFAATC